MLYLEDPRGCSSSLSKEFLFISRFYFSIYCTRLFSERLALLPHVRLDPREDLNVEKIVKSISTVYLLNRHLKGELYSIDIFKQQHTFKK